MLELNNKIRSSISDSQHLRELAKNDKLSREKVNELYDKARENDKKVIFLKNLSNALKEEQNETERNNRRY